jgi:hypothetical protein
LELTPRHPLRYSAAIPAAVLMDEKQSGECERVLSECRSAQQILNSLLRRRRLLIEEHSNLRADYVRLLKPITLAVPILIDGNFVLDFLAVVWNKS